MLNKKSPGLTGLIQSNSGGNDDKDKNFPPNSYHLKVEKTLLPNTLLLTVNYDEKELKTIVGKGGGNG